MQRHHHHLHKIERFWMLGLFETGLIIKMIKVTHLDGVTGGAHAKRSRSLYSLAFPDQVKIGVVSLKPDRYDLDT